MIKLCNGFVYTVTLSGMLRSPAVPNRVLRTTSSAGMARCPRRAWEEQPRVVWCVPGSVPRRPTPPRAHPHRGAELRTSHAREEDVMDHPDYPTAPDHSADLAAGPCPAPPRL